MVARRKIADVAEPSETDVVTDVRRGVELPAESYYLAPWRKLPPLPRPAAAPFDHADCLRRLGRVKPADDGGREWEAAGLPPAMAPEEADFWLLAMVHWCEGRGRADVLRALQATTFTGRVAYPKALELFRQPRRTPPPLMALALANLLGPDRFLDSLLNGEFKMSDTVYYSRNVTELALLQGAWQHVQPYLSDAETAALRETVRPRLKPDLWPKQFNDPLALPYHLAALLGMHEEVWQLVRTWQFADRDPARNVLNYHGPLLVLLGLRDPGVFSAKVRELGLALHSRFDMRAWFAMTGAAGVGYAAEQVLRSRGGNRVLVEEFSRVADPAAARPMLAFRVKGKHPAVARGWLDRHLGSAVAGLLPSAGGRDKISLAAADHLRDLAKRGYGWVIERELPALDGATAARVRRLVLDRPERVVPELAAADEPDWLRKELVGWPPRFTAPEWLGVATLPPVLLDGYRFGRRHVEALVAEAKHAWRGGEDSLVGPAAPFAAALRRHADPASLDAFAVALFERWLAEKTTSKDGWVLPLAGRLGGDACVDAIVPRLRRWPGTASARRIKDAMTALRAIGSDYAVAQHTQLGRGHPNPRYREFALAELDLAAAERGLSPDQLEDRCVPDLGLARGGPVIDFGPRRFRLAIGANLQAVATDERGKPHAALPTPRKSDDPVLVAEGREAFRRMKTQVSEVVGLVCERLERGLIHGRRWDLVDFEQYIVKHPIAGAVARRLVWGWYAADGSLAGTFRVTAEGEFADAADRAATPGASQIGLVHPVLRTAEERSAWLDLLADYELVQPFPQLGRRVFDLSEADRNAKLVESFNAKGIPGVVLHRSARHDGWRQDGGCVRRAFPAAGVTAVAQVIGWDRRELKGCVFISGVAAVTPFDPAAALSLSQVCPVVRCEVFADLDAWAKAAGQPL